MKDSYKMGRLDFYLFQCGKVKSRQKAKELVLDGGVSVNGKVVKKPSFPVSDADAITVSGGLRYVGRGGLKLEKAIDCFNLDFSEKTALDVGASTGGFTDCLLQHGAVNVYALDVGHGQLDAKLRKDPRVVNLEGLHVKDLTRRQIQNLPDVITVDVSFISLKKVLLYLLPFLKDDFQMVCLVKPQFEIGRTDKGIVRKPEDHEKVLYSLLDFLSDLHFAAAGLDYSPVTGSEGNIEFLLYIKKQGLHETLDVAGTVRRAHSALR